MPITAQALIALLKLSLIFACILFTLRLRVPLWAGILTGSVLTAILNKISFADLIRFHLGVVDQPTFISLIIIIFLILALSGLQAASGQSNKLVVSLERHLQEPRLRLVLFPALVGLLPMPGGALFSCPMLDEAARNIKISPEEKGIINYWFRHMWELAWPLYPGYILASSLLDLPLSAICTYTFPMVFVFFLVGWFFYMPRFKNDSLNKYKTRDEIPNKSYLHNLKNAEQDSDNTKEGFIIHALPLIISIGGAGLIVLLSAIFKLELSTQLAFISSLTAGIICAYIQGRHELKGKILNIFFNIRSFNLLMVLFMIYAFKDIILTGEFIEALTSLSTNKISLYLLFFIFPFIAGAITGVMVAYVGVSFPILLGLISQAGLKDHTLPLMILALFAGNLGQMISPLHVCFVVTCDYFKSGLANTWKYLPKPLTVLAIIYCFYVSLLYWTGASF